MAQYQIRMGRLDWRGKAALAVAIALGLAAALALVVVSLGLALVLLPIVAVGLVIGRWRLDKLMAEARKASAKRTDEDRTIEIEYSVIDGERRR